MNIRMSTKSIIVLNLMIPFLSSTYRHLQLNMSNQTCVVTASNHLEQNLIISCPPCWSAGQTVHPMQCKFGDVNQQRTRRMLTKYCKGWVMSHVPIKHDTIWLNIQFFFFKNFLLTLFEGKKSILHLLLTHISVQQSKFYF